MAAQVELAPVKGTKMKPAVVKLTQEEGKPTTVSEVSIEGLKPGKYQLVVHESGECGPNAAKAGKVVTTADTIMVEVEKEAGAKVANPDVTLKLEGDQAIIGKTLVLHEDRQGKPGKVHACGVVAKLDMPSEPSAIGPTRGRGVR